MKFTDLLKVVGDEPLFETGFLLAGDVDPSDVRRQLSRWVRSGWLYQLRRGLYSLAPPFQRTRPDPFLVANQMTRGSYVSLHSALAYYALIPETIPVITSVTTRRPARWETPLGIYEFRRVKLDLFYGYRLLETNPGQRAFVATPEKALLDLAYLTAGADDPLFLRELRLQNLDQLDLDVLKQLAERSGRPKVRRVASCVTQLAAEEVEGYEAL